MLTASSTLTTLCHHPLPFFPLKLRRGGLAHLLGGVVDAGRQHAQGLGLVLVLAALVLDGHHHARREVRDAHRRLGRVHVLPARARGPGKYNDTQD